MIQSLIFSAVSIAMGVFYFTWFMGASTFLEPIVEKCTSGSLVGLDFFTPVGIQYVDNFLCFITPYFIEIKKAGNIGAISFFWVMGPYFAMLLYSGIEATRKTSFLFSHQAALVFTIAQVITIGVALPLLWLPCYLFSNRASQTSPKNRPGYINQDAVFIVAFSAWVVGMSGPTILYGMESFTNIWINIFQFVPLVGVLVNIFLLLDGYCEDLRDGLEASIAARNLFKIFAVMLAGIWYYMIYLVYQMHPDMNFQEISNTFIQIFNADPKSALSCTKTLFIDGFGVISTMILFFMAEEGIFTLVEFFGLSILIGPGSAFLLLAVRKEDHLMKKLINLAKGDKSKKNE